MQIKSATFQISAPSLAACPESSLPEFAFIGRSNVGKSSLLNMLTGRAGLAKVSSTPGHTQLINFFTINESWNLVDLPGYGYAQKSKQERERFQQLIFDYLTGRPNLTRIFVLIDSRHEPQLIDLEFVEHMLSEGAPLVLVFTKVDKLKPALLQKNIAQFHERVAAWTPQPLPTFTTSILSKAGRRELLGYIGQQLTAVKS
jgi:GTP-binding protein